MDKRKVDGVLIKKVLAYYRKKGRHNLEWRKKISAYRVLVSEVMLQQTQVVRAIPKFRIWMKKYPTLSSLKKASLKEVLLLWQGLGYQRRAKALYDIARHVTKVPTVFEELCELKGIGTYTAGAVCAFAYDFFSHPLLETNIRTVLIEEYHTKRKKVDDTTLYKDLLRLEKHSFVLRIGARRWYYALMDYGAHLKEQRISHNKKSSHYVKQTPYKGSIRELRAKILFAVVHEKEFPKDARVKGIVEKLVKEGYIVKKNHHYVLF